MQKKKVCLYHRVMRRENFEKAAKDLVDLVLSAQRKEPDKPRVLYVDIDGHRDAEGKFDRDMLELQKEFGLKFLLQFLEEVHFPIYSGVNQNKQNNDVPQGLQIFDANNKKDDSLDKLYIENYSNTEFMSEKEVYAYLVQVSDFLKNYNDSDMEYVLMDRFEYDPMGWIFRWRNHIKEMIMELFNSFIYGNLISAAAMTRTLMECYVYLRILMEAQSEEVIDNWFLCSVISGSKRDEKKRKKTHEIIKSYCEVRGIELKEAYSKLENGGQNAWLAELCGKRRVTFADACQYLGDSEICADLQYLCAFVHGQDVTTKLEPFLSYSSIYDKFYIMMSYIFKTIRLYPLKESKEQEIEILENSLLELSKTMI